MNDTWWKNLGFCGGVDSLEKLREEKKIILLLDDQNTIERPFIYMEAKAYNSNFISNVGLN